MKSPKTQKKGVENVNRSFINYAHRGASEYAPENTMLAFNMGIEMGANGIETDIQLTKDRIAVLFHDDTLTRVTGEPGSVKDYTFAELQNFYVRKNGLKDRIPTLDAFFESFGRMNLTFAIELKVPGVEKLVADTVYRYGVQNKVVITSFLFDAICAMRDYAPELKCGFLTSDTSDPLLYDLRTKGFYEFCPRADITDNSSVDKWHRMGFNVRAWDVSNTELMERAYHAGVDGMTVNFPDKLDRYIRDRRK